MNKFTIAIAIVAVCAAGLVAANKLPSHHKHQHSDDDWEFEGGHHGGHQGVEHHPRHSHHGHNNHHSNDDDWESNRHGGFHNCGECIRQRNSHKVVTPHSGKHIKRTGSSSGHSGGSSGHSGSSSGHSGSSSGHSGSGVSRHGSSNGSNEGDEGFEGRNRVADRTNGERIHGDRAHVGGAGIGAVGGTGAVGGFRDHRDQSAGLEGRTHLGNRKSIEGHKSFGAGEDRNIKAGHVNHARDENEGIRKHQVLNRDKTIIKDRTTGVNDVDGFRHASERTNGAGFEASDNKFVGGNAGASANSDREFDNRFAAGEESDRDVEAGGAIGQVGAVGAGVGGGSF